MTTLATITPAMRSAKILGAIAGILLALFLAASFGGCGEPPVADSLKNAQQEIDSGNSAKGISELERLLERSPKNSDVKEALAFAQLNSGNAARAGELFNQLGLEKNSDDLLYAAQAYKKAKENDNAIEAYRLYLLSEPQQAEPWKELGELLIDAGKVPAGIAALAKAEEISPSAELSLQIGTLYAQNGNASQAERYLQSALRQSRAARAPESAPSEIEGNALAQLAQLAIDAKKNSEAERHIKQLERDFPNHPKLADLKSKLLPQAPSKETPSENNSANATPPSGTIVASTESKNSSSSPITPSVVSTPTTTKPDPMNAVSGDRQNPELWTALARAKEKEGDLDWAETSYLEAMRLKPGEGATIVAYLEVVKKRRSPAEFLGEAESQLQKYPEIPDIYIVTARGYRDLMQNKRNARIIFKRFLDKFPTNPEAPTIKAELDELNKQ